MEKLRNGHEDSPIQRDALGEIRGALESLRASLGDLERGEEIRPPRRSRTLAPLAIAAALDLLARKISAPPAKPRRRKRGFVKLMALSAAVIAAGTLIAARR